MESNKEIRQEIQRLKEKLSERKKDIEKIETLIQRKVDREPGLWEFNFNELEEEMWNRFLSMEKNEEEMWNCFLSLEKNSDCLNMEEIKSSRKMMGWIIVLFKKILRKITTPYSRMILARQSRFNRELIPFFLASVLSLQKIKDRLNVLEARTKKVIENQEDLFDELNTLKLKINKQKKEQKK